MKRRILAFILTFLFALTTVVGETTPAPLKVHFISTGNSDAILIQDNGKSMLIDGGDNDDEQSLVKYIKDAKVKKLDYVVLTHPDADHCGGLDAVIENLKVGKVLIGNGSADTKTYRDFVNSAINKGLQPSVPLEDTFKLGNASLKFYNQKSVEDSDNDNSLVMLLTNGKNKFLFTGDAGSDIEKKLPLKEIGKVDVLKIGHHGSKSSSSDEFIKSISPKYSVICVGKDNKYHHPHKQTVDTLNKYKTTIYRTDLNGNVIVTSDGAKVMVNTQKVAQKSNAPAKSKKSSVTSVVKAGQKQDKTVYITKTGKKYHVESCRSLKSSKIKSTVKEAQKLGLDPCKVCNP